MALITTHHLSNTRSDTRHNVLYSNSIYVRSYPWKAVGAIIDTIYTYPGLRTAGFQRDTAYCTR